MSNFVEDCFSISPRDFGWRADRIRKLGVNTLERRPGLHYWFDDMSNPTQLFVSVDGEEPQLFVWEVVDITFGEKAYFYCPCGYRAMKLYLPPGGKEFKCRACHKLRYRLTALNRNSGAGKILYQANRLQKLSDSRERMGRLFYNGAYTAKLERFLNQCKKAGLNNVVEGFEELRTLTHTK